MQVWNVLHAARWKYSTQKIAKNSPSAHHRATLSGYLFATKAHIDNRKNLLSSNISSTCPRNMVNSGPLAAEILSLVWGTPGKFQWVLRLGSVTARHLVVGVRRRKKEERTRMWANAQPDGRPAEHRWRPLFNAAKFGWRPLLDDVQ